MKKLEAKWIWNKQRSYQLYNDTIIAKKDFTLDNVKEALMRITADSYYRLYINDRWICDGPARSWKDHYSYDEFDVGSYLQKGQNTITVIARYFGVGTFHQVPAQAGLLAQLDVKLKNGKSRTVITDGSWKTASAKQWEQNTAKISVQMEPFEYYDARLETNSRFTAAAVLFDARQGVWKNLKPRDVKMLSLIPTEPVKFLGAKTIADEAKTWCIPFRRVLAKENIIEANKNFHKPFMVAAILDVSKECTISIDSYNSSGVLEKAIIDGKSSKSGKYKLSAGKHTAVFISGFFECDIRRFHSHDLTIILNAPDCVKLVNPLKKGFENPWAFMRFEEFDFQKDDLKFKFLLESDKECREKYDAFQRLLPKLKRAAKGADSLVELLKTGGECISSSQMFTNQTHSRFIAAKRSEGAQVEAGESLMCDNPHLTTIKPSKTGAVELVYDLGIQRCGYYDFELCCEAGVEVDIYGVEYITPSGKIQHSMQNRNGMTYITKEGVNKFTSLKRRSGRYIFITLRNMKKPVQIRKFGVIESTYPVEYKGSFNCSDYSLNRIWEISATTLKLCMEDTFTDCPLYEQTLWVGDARNESLFAYDVFGAEDISRRCIELTAQSLRYYPLVGGQLPSAWDMILPAWSFLWGISVWEYYYRTGDKNWLKTIFKSVMKNIDGAMKYVDDSGLMSCDFWNFFDWAEIDSQQKTVLYNTMLLVAAINAALKCSKTLGKNKDTAKLTAYRKDLVAAVNKYWDKDKNSYPDSLLEDGSPSKSTCQHTSFLAVLYDIVKKDNLQAAIKNITNPPKQMVKVGSPFAIMYLYEALEKIGQSEKIIDSIIENYMPMLESGATTVWESFPTGTLSKEDFPTRSHCHAWSSAPIYFFNRIILGIKQTAPACKSYDVSPYILKNLQYAKGSVATLDSQLEVDWRKDGKTLNLTIKAAKGVKVRFVKNSSMDGLKIKTSKQTL